MDLLVHSIACRGGIRQKSSSSTAPGMQVSWNRSSRTPTCAAGILAWRYKGRCQPYFATSTAATMASLGSPDLIRCSGARACSLPASLIEMTIRRSAPLPVVCQVKTVLGSKNAIAFSPRMTSVVVRHLHSGKVDGILSGRQILAWTDHIRDRVSRVGLSHPGPPAYKTHP